MKLLLRLEKSKDFWTVFVLTTLFVFLRIPSLFEPYWYGDEGIYEVVGQALDKGRLLYVGIWDNKPPLLYLIYAFFNGNQEAARFASLVFGALAIVVFYFLNKKLFSLFKQHAIAAATLSTSLFAVLFGLPILEGNIANAENFMLLPLLCAAFLVYASIGQQEQQAKRMLLYGGALVGVAFLFKIVAVFDFAAFFLAIVFLKLPNVSKNAIIQTAKGAFPFCIGFFLPIAFTITIFMFLGNFTAFIQSVFLQMFGYVDYGNRLIIPQGLLIIKLSLLAIGVLAVFLKRKTLAPATLFVLLWLFFSLFNAFFAQRPYTHYVLVLLPSFLLLIGIWIVDAKTRLVVTLLLVVCFAVVYHNFSYYKKSFGYYENFFSFVTSRKNVSNYQRFFDPHVLVDYDIANYLKSKMNKNDTVYMWGNSAQLYALLHQLPAGRFIVAYHSNATHATRKETADAFMQAKPKYLIIVSADDTPPFPLTQYAPRMTIDKAAIYERFAY